MIDLTIVTPKPFSKILKKNPYLTSIAFQKNIKRSDGTF